MGVQGGGGVARLMGVVRNGRGVELMLLLLLVVVWLMLVVGLGVETGVVWVGGRGLKVGGRSFAFSHHAR